MKRLRVNPILCDGFGYCAELLPDNITLDDWGFPIVDPDVPTHLVSAARRAVTKCPRNAVLLDDKPKAPPAPPPTTWVGAIPLRRPPLPPRNRG